MTNQKGTQHPDKNEIHMMVVAEVGIGRGLWYSLHAEFIYLLITECGTSEKRLQGKAKISALS